MATESVPGTRLARYRALTAAERAALGDYTVRNRAHLECACGGLLAEDDRGHVFCLRCEGSDTDD